MNDNETRLADDGNWYTKSEFEKFYPDDFDNRFKQAPPFLERRKESKEGPFMDPMQFYNKYGSGDRWGNDRKDGWETAIREKRLGDDGVWYEFAEFREFYINNDWNNRWEKAPSEAEYRYSVRDLQAHDAKWFWLKNKEMDADGSRSWDKNQKFGWQEAPLVQPQAIML